MWGEGAVRAAAGVLSPHLRSVTLFSPPCPLPRGFSPLLQTIAAHKHPNFLPRWKWQEVLGATRGAFGVYHHPTAMAFILSLLCAPPGSQGSDAPSQSCSIHLSPSPVTDPSEIACAAQSNPQAESGVLAPMGVCVVGMPQLTQGPQLVLGSPWEPPPPSGASFCPRSCSPQTAWVILVGKKVPLFAPLKVVKN